MTKPAVALLAASAMVLPAAALAAPQITIAPAGPVVELSAYQEVTTAPEFATISAGVVTEAPLWLLMVVVAPRVVNRLGFKTPIVIGMLLLATGMAILSLVRPDGSFAVDVLPASLIAAAGMALAFIPSLGTAISSARPRTR